MFSVMALTLASAATPSSLVYLDCTIQQQGSAVEWKITLNEADGTVDYDNPISGPQRRPARFTADSVYFVGFILSRVDLSIHREVNILGDVHTDAGTCHLATLAKRAF